MKNDDSVFKIKVPDKLTKQEMSQLLKEMSEGSRDAREKIISHNIRLVTYEIQKKFNNVDYEKEDLVSIGITGLIKAVDTFDISKGIEFATYAIRCIDNEIYMLLRKLGKEKVVKSINDIVTTKESDGKKLTYEDTVADPYDFVVEHENKEIYKFIRNEVALLKGRDKDIITMAFGFNRNNKVYTQREIGDILNISQSHISRLINKIVEKIRVKLKDNNLIEYCDNTSFSLKKIYQILNDYTKDQIDEIIDKLPKYTKDFSDTKIIITILKYGYYKERYHKNKEISDMLGVSENYVSAFISQINKIIELNENKNDELFTRYKNMKEKDDMKRLKTIYEYFNDFSKGQIDLMLQKLTDEERQLVYLRYGNDLNNPVQSELSYEERTRFYNSIIPKMKKILHKDILKYSKDQQEEKNAEETKNVTENVPVIEAKSKDNKDMSKEDCIKMLELLRTPTFSQMNSVLTTKEAVIISLKLGYVDGKYFSNSSIANFLQISEEEVIETTKKVLLVYKENINNFIDNVIYIATNDKQKKY